MAVGTRTKKRSGQKPNLNSDSPTPLVPVAVSPSARQTEPGNWTASAGLKLGGGSFIARRQIVDPLMASTASKLQSLAASDSMRLLGDLPAIHPSVGLALWNALRLTCTPGQTRVSARKREKVKGKDGKLDWVPDDEMTLSIKQMFESQPPEVGGLEGLRGQLTISGLFTGMMPVEVVPGAALMGAARVYPVDALSIFLDRTERGGDLKPFQMQVQPGNGISMLARARTGNWGFGGSLVELNTEKFFYKVIDQTPTTPYGLAPYATALSEVIADLALMQDLRDAVHNAAWPRLDVGVDMINLHKVAVEVHKLTNPKQAAAWVTERFNEVVEYIGKLGPSDNVVHHSTAKPGTIQPGGFTGLEGVLNFLRQRIVQSLKTLPTLLGISDGGTQNYTSVEWQIYAAGLECIAAMVDELIIKIAELHCRLMGSDCEVVIERDKVRTTDALVEANTLNMRINNAILLEKMGYESHEEACRQLTGHDPIAEPRPGMLDTPTADNMTREGGKDGPKQGGQGGNVNTTNSTSDERGGAGKRSDKNSGHN